MTITSIAFYAVARHTWGWPRATALPMLVLLLAIDLPFLAANLIKCSRISAVWTARRSGLVARTSIAGTTARSPAAPHLPGPIIREGTLRVVLSGARELLLLLGDGVTNDEYLHAVPHVSNSQPEGTGARNALRAARSINYFVPSISACNCAHPTRSLRYA